MSGVDAQRESDVLKQHFYRWQVKSHSLVVLKAWKMFLYPPECCLISSPIPVCLFITQIVILSIALLSPFDARIDMSGEKPVWCKHTETQRRPLSRVCVVFPSSEVVA